MRCHVSRAVTVFLLLMTMYFVMRGCAWRGPSQHTETPFPPAGLREPNQPQATPRGRRDEPPAPPLWAEDQTARRLEGDEDTAGPARIPIYIPCEEAQCIAHATAHPNEWWQELADARLHVHYVLAAPSAGLDIIISAHSLHRSATTLVLANAVEERPPVAKELLMLQHHMSHGRTDITTKSDCDTAFRPSTLRLYLDWLSEQPGPVYHGRLGSSCNER
jgi:hypothetical protein